MSTDIVIATFAVVASCVLLIVLAIQFQIKGLFKNVEDVLKELKNK